jgi:hypothetical protein
MAAGRHSHIAKSVEALHEAQGRFDFFGAQLIRSDGSVQSVPAIDRIKNEQLIEYSLAPLFTAHT